MDGSRRRRRRKRGTFGIPPYRGMIREVDDSSLLEVLSVFFQSYNLVQKTTAMFLWLLGVC